MTKGATMEKMKMAKAKTPQTGDPKNFFVTLTPGKLTGLRQITDAGGRFKVFALDQSNSFKKALRALHEKTGSKAEPTYAEIRDAKLEMVRELAGQASAVLLDVNYGLRQAIAAFALPRGVGLIARVEASRDAGLPGEFEPGWGVAPIKRMGASAVKLLVYMDTEDRKATEAQMALVRRVSEDCRKEDILLMTEELSYPRAGEDKKSPSYLKRKVANILEATRLIGPYTDILKLEFPGDIKNDPPARLQENLAKLDAAALRPWVLLSAGEKFELFAQQVELAMKAGCTGYMAGRAIFNEYFEQTSPAERTKFLRSTGLERMGILNRLIDQFATPWPDRCGLKPADLAAAVDPLWYLPEGGRKPQKPQAPVKGEY